MGGDSSDEEGNAKFRAPHSSPKKRKRCLDYSVLSMSNGGIGSSNGMRRSWLCEMCGMRCVDDGDYPSKELELYVDDSCDSQSSL